MGGRGGSDQARRAPLRWLLPLSFSAVSIGCGGASPTTTASSPAPSASPGRPGPPNIILIVADDMGYGDLSSYGSPTIKTPEIDRLAADGVRLTQFVVAAAVCTPSRGAILTGLHPVQSRITANLGNADDRPGLTAALPSLAAILKGRGYATAALGKWGLGDGPTTTMPLQNGFDSYYGKIYGSSDRLIEGSSDAAVGVPGEYLEREFAARAVAFIKANASRPFFLYYASFIPHTPLQPAPEFKGRSAGGTYGDVVEELDHRVGEMREAVRAAGVERSTLIWFLSDNGPPLLGGEGGSPGPFGGPGKNTPYESGIRVPGIVSWPGTIPPGQIVATPVSSLDIVPTLTAVSGASLSPRFIYFGADVQPVLTGRAATIPGSGVDGGREIMAYNGSATSAFRSGRYKVVYPGWWVSRAQLFDLETDPSESVDVRTRRPDLFETLAARADQVWAQAAANAVPE